MIGAGKRRREIGEREMALFLLLIIVAIALRMAEIGRGHQPCSSSLRDCLGGDAVWVEAEVVPWCAVA